MQLPSHIPRLPVRIFSTSTHGLQPRTLRRTQSKLVIKRVSVKDELRANLIKKLRAGEKLFPGIVGYDETVIPQLVNAILVAAQHHPARTARPGQEPHHSSTHRICSTSRFRSSPAPKLTTIRFIRSPPTAGRRSSCTATSTPIDWIGRDARFVEKLATPDVTIADIIGDVDPIKAAKGGHLLSDELTIHYGLLPRANRGIFAINELPDLAGKIQVGLFNIMQEGDVQIKGYPVRLPLDVMLVFSANPEDYTARGKIITPLKDRIGAEIMTHYPAEIADWRRDHPPGSLDRSRRTEGSTAHSGLSFAKSSNRSPSKRATTVASTSIPAFRNACRSR